MLFATNSASIRVSSPEEIASSYQLRCMTTFYAKSMKVIKGSPSAEKERKQQSGGQESAPESRKWWKNASIVRRRGQHSPKSR
jgi:hypothetical protein